jgi:hypothetical protein
MLENLLSIKFALTLKYILVNFVVMLQWIEVIATYMIFFRGDKESVN